MIFHHLDDEDTSTTSGALLGPADGYVGPGMSWCCICELYNDISATGLEENVMTYTFATGNGSLRGVQPKWDWLIIGQLLVLAN